MPHKTLTDCEAFFARARIAARNAWIDARHRDKRSDWASWRDEELPWRFRDAAENWNALTSALQVYDLQRDPPERFTAYVGKLEPVPGFPYEKVRKLTTWTGQQIGTCRLGASWPVHSAYGSRTFQIYARVNGRNYTGRGFGEGFAVNLKRTKE